MVRAAKVDGFDGRTFLTEPEWATYRRRRPVRYTKPKELAICEKCGKAGTQDNPLQNAHRIGFAAGVSHFALTPDFLDRPEMLKRAHRKGCNRSVEAKTLVEVCVLLRNECGIEELPSFLDGPVLAAWNESASGQ